MRYITTRRGQKSGKSERKVRKKNPEPQNDTYILPPKKNKKFYKNHEINEDKGKEDKEKDEIYSQIESLQMDPLQMDPLQMDPLQMDPLQIESSQTEISQVEETGTMFQMEEKDMREVESDNVKNWDEWVAATSTKNFLMDDGFLDVLQHQSASVIRANSVYAKEIGRLIGSVNNHRSFVSTLLTFGNIFEYKMVEKITAIVGEKNTVNIGGNNNARSLEKYNATVSAIMSGVPVIYEGVLRNYENKTYGVTDILIRSDWINKILSLPPLETSQTTVKAPKLKGKYHYVVIDIKYKSLPLRADGTHLRNDANMKAYKSQLWIYTDALSKIQGYTPPYAFILGSKWKYTSRAKIYEGNFALSRLGKIDYENLDLKYISKTEEAVSWIKAVRKNNYDLSKYPLERDELYPNMCNRHDYPYHKIKKMYAEANKDLTLIWNIGPKQRRIANSKGVYTWDDKRCNSKTLGVGGEIKPKVIDRILEANHSDIKGEIIYPKIIENNHDDWKNKDCRKIELYVDFEMTCSVFSDLEDVPFNTGASFIFLIGAGYICPNDNKWKFKHFVVDRINELEEERICTEFKKYIGDLSKKYFILDPIPCWHYSHAEKSSWNRFGDRRNDGAPYVEWRDMLKIFLKEPVGIKGALSYGLKTIAKTFHDNGFIKTCYDDNLGCADGSDAAVGAFRANKECENKNIKLSSHPLIKEIIKYNEIDCKVLQEIMYYLRKNHSGIVDVINIKERSPPEPPKMIRVTKPHVETPKSHVETPRYNLRERKRARYVQ